MIEGQRKKGFKCCEPRWCLAYRDVGSMQLGMSAGAVGCWLFSWAELRLGIAFVPRGYMSIDVLVNFDWDWGIILLC